MGPFLDGDGPHEITVADRCITAIYEKQHFSYTPFPLAIIRLTTPEWTLEEFFQGESHRVRFKGVREQFERDVVLFRLAKPV